MKKPGQASAFKTYRQKLVTQYASGEAGEHAYRPALQEFIESFSKKLRVTNEPGKRGRGKKGDTQNKPDFIVSNGQAPLGFIEAKDINVDLDEVADGEQIARYCDAYPNLILTDYLEFRRYVKGQLRGNAIRIGKANSKKHEIVFSQSAETQVQQFFKDFLLEEVESVSSPQELANRLAVLTRQIRELVLKELVVPEESKALHQLMKAFKEVLLSDLEEKKFADMFAQTLTYGLFAARVHHDGKSEFSRLTAGNILPPTNRFLRKLFTSFMNDHLPEAVSAVADDIIDLLKKTDIKKILEHFSSQGKEDAVVYFYESFLASYDANLRKKMGVYYTPAPVVDFMVRSVDQALQSHFGRKKGIADEKALILDPALGTGSFLRRVISGIHDRVTPGKWDGYVSESLLGRIFGFEILMAPYSISHLKLGLQLHETGYAFNKDERLGVYLTNTLEETAKKSELLFGDWISEEANAAARVKRDLPIMVVIGNPPYSYDSSNNGDWINSLLHGFDSLSGAKVGNYFECEGSPLGERNPRGLNDDYVKFLRFAQWRITQSNQGIVVFITNHGFLDNPTFRGMRESLLRDFDELYFLDLHGNSNKKERGPKGEVDENVFGIQQGVCISILMRHPDAGEKRQKGIGKVFRYDIYGTREEKFDWLSKSSFESTPFKEVYPDGPNYLFKTSNAGIVEEYERGMKLTELFPVNSVGIITFRDKLTVHFTESEAWETVKTFNALDTEKARDHFQLGDDSRDWTVSGAKSDIRQSGPSKSRLTRILYRPFDLRHTYYTGRGRGFMATPRHELMQHMVQGDNLAIIAPRTAKNPRHCFVTDTLACHKTYDSYDTNYVFPLLLNGANKKDRQINFGAEFKARLKDLFGKIDNEVANTAFKYVYAVLHSKTFVVRYNEQLKEDFPRVQVTKDKRLFMELAKLGAELLQFHLMSDDRLEGGKCVFAVKGTDVVESVTYRPKEGKVYINKTQYFEGMSEDAFNFQVGGYQVLDKWLKDRKGRKLSHTDKGEYERLVEAISRTMDLIEKIDKTIDRAGGWPLAAESDGEEKKAA